MLPAIKSAIFANQFAFDLALRVRNVGHNKRLAGIQKKSAEMDIFCSDEIIETNKYLQSIMKDDGSILSFSRVFSESLHYGHLNAVFDYAGIDMDNAIYFPTMEHGCFLTRRIYHSKGGMASMGGFRRDSIRNAHPHIPVFLLGPYIHYARPYYDGEKFAALKGRWGRTLLIIPQHTIETSVGVYDMRGFIRNIMETLAPQFNTVAACLYWKDFDTELYGLLRAHGIEVISAGYRWDYNFIRKLKTAISLSDMVVSNSISTHVGYCMYLDKPFKYIETNTQLSEKNRPPNTPDELITINGLKAVFSSDLDKQSQMDACEPFWGFSEIKSKDEIREILSIWKKVMWLGMGNYSRYHGAALSLLKSGAPDSQKKRLADALGIQ